MGEAFLFGNGGGGKTYAVIGVDYPVGSVCTCTNGSKTLKAADTSGKAIFNVPSAGVWVVTATDGINSKSESVEITTKGQTTTIELQYRLYLYKYGNEYSTLTGGWSGKAAQVGVASTKTASPSVTKNTDNIVASLNASATGGVLTAANKIDLSNYSKLKFSGNINSKAQYAIAGFYVLNDLSYWSDRAVAKVATSNTNTITNGEIDISALNGEYYVAFGVYHNVSVQITEVWLE